MARGITTTPAPLCIQCGKRRNGYFHGNRCRRCYRAYAATWALELDTGRAVRYRKPRRQLKERTE